MIVKFFGSRGGGSASLSVGYLINQEKHDNKAEILQGDPELSRDIAEGLDFANTYTVGCLSFEEDNIPEEDKRAIMERFEQSMFAGLDKEQYNILWVQHTDKDRLELNFFIPNVELTSGKRLQPYYDKADRPITENFKQVINHEYGLTDPNAPEKQQTLITKDRLPKAKKEALEAINNGIEELAKAGQINSREDVIQALEGAGFEIARATPKNLSIKTEGQNLRLKGAFYEQSFQFGEGIRETIEERNDQYNRERGERYQTARKRLDSVVSKRKQEFRKRYPNRTSEIDKEISQNIQHTELGISADIGGGGGRADVSGEPRVQQDEGMGNVRSQLPKDKPIAENKPLQSERHDKSLLHRDRPELQGAILGRQGQSSHITNKSGGLTNDTKRETVRERIERIIGQVRERFIDVGERISRITGRKRLDKDELQRNNETKRTNQQAINDINHVNQAIKSARKEQSRGQGMSR